MVNRTENKKRIGVLDIFIILIVLIVIASIVVRFLANKNSDYSENTELDSKTTSKQVRISIWTREALSSVRSERE